MTVNFQEIMLELISYSYASDFRNRVFGFEKQWKYQKIYHGNKPEFAKLYLRLLLKEFASSVEVWHNHTKLTLETISNFEEIVAEDELCKLTVDTRKFYEHCAGLECLENLLRINHLEAESMQSESNSTSFDR